MPEVTLTGEVEPFGLDKRTYIPGKVLAWTCSNCGNPAERDFESNYLSYPDTNTPIKVNLWCPECDYDDDSIQVMVLFDLVIVPS